MVHETKVIMTQQTFREHTYGGEYLYFQKNCQHSRLGQATCNNITNKFLKFLCLCNLLRLDETFKVWWSWVNIINYTIRIVVLWFF